jgi:hypothetical protein
MSRTPPGLGACRHCGDSIAHWETHFCRHCGRHNDALYCAEAPDPRPRGRVEIIAEYRAAGLIAEASRLTAEPDDPASADAPTLSSEPTALTQRSLFDLLDSA